MVLRAGDPASDSCRIRGRWAHESGGVTPDSVLPWCTPWSTRVALKHFGLRAIAKVEECASDFYAITIERRVKHPVVAAITEHAYSELFA